MIVKILKLVQHLESQSNSPHFELLFDVLAEILTKLQRFKMLIYF